MARKAQAQVKAAKVSKVEEKAKEVNNFLANHLVDKTVIADTSSLLIRGTDLLRSLPVCHLIIPAVVVKELEGKRNNSGLGFLAREWLRLLEDLRFKYGEELGVGVKVPEDFTSTNIVISIEPNHSSQEVLPKQLRDGSNDSTILAVAKAFSDDLKGNVALISNDVPMRIHSTLEIKVPAYEISSATIDSAKPFSGRIAVHVTDEQVDEIFDGSNQDYAEQNKLVKNEIDGETSHALVDIVHNGAILKTVLYNDADGIQDLPRGGNRAKNISPKSIEQRVAMNYLLRSVEELPIVSVAGSAGTGKTLLTLAAGLEGVRLNRYRKVLVLRSLHEMGAGQEMGFLPGGVEEKIAPWSGAVMDSLEVIARSAKKGAPKTENAEVAKLKAEVEVSPISYLRGQSITDTYMVLDEAQNFSRNELLNIISRAGEGTKVVLLYDSAQVDSKYLQSGPKAEVWSVVDSLKSSELFGHITLTKSERSKVAELASRILER